MTTSWVEVDMEQLSLDTKQVKVRVYKEGDKKYLALIGNGWYMAYGTTAKGAFKNVEKRFHRELDYLG